MGAVSTRTMLFTDVEGSTALLQRVGPRYPELLARHNEILRAAIGAHDGEELSNEGDSFVVLFPTVSATLAAALEAQRGVTSTAWAEDAEIRVRMGVHVGEVADTPAGLVGRALHQAARIASSAHGGQVVLSEAVRLLADRLPDGAGLRPLGEHRLRDVGATLLYQLTHPTLPSEFPPLRADRGARHNIPAPLTTLVGRDEEATSVEKLLDVHRLLTLIGAGGCGKTRLAMRAAAEWLSRASSDVWFVELATLTTDGLVAATVAEAIIGHQPGGDALSVGVDAMRGHSTLLVLDNCEHLLVACAELVEELLRRCPQLRVLSTSRESLGVPGEAVFRVPSLNVPPAGSRFDDIQDADAVRLFEERVRLVEPDYAVSAADADAVVDICRRLDG